ncbi:MAG: MBOAT family protein [Chloroflexi bacterium]|jgi:alginate O-acetyltransferase complex protein AlgI|nr:MBOAT family protein [Chloroflexota bacterium]MBT4515172.1 MBOAT family protein [Chloroflexota bacterium]MBT5319749.1 MBOAT family protein [Chloroflexota bacterium]MBT6681551.1 MBOAT family protein [Chloroflexota bacterium]
MVFSSLEFLFRFLPAILLLYFIAPRRLKNPILLVGSLFFYAWGEPVFVVLMVLSSAINYFLALWIDKFRGSARSGYALAASVVVSLALLGFFKYADLLVDTVNSGFGSDFSPLDLPLPIGISFYTFQILSYTIDVYKDRVPVQRNPISLAMYIALFPQLIAGPIVRYRSVASAIDNRTHSLEMFSDGVHRFVIGLAKKVLIANNIGLLWDSAVTTSEPSVMLAWLGIAAFSFQIYFDFSGYSDMAIGLGRMLGFRYPENFNYPYISQSVTEFWRRWHMSLGQWFRDYLYIPLGGNRVSRLMWVRNVLIVWFLTGLWHGASWNFAIWGLYFGVLLLIERVFLATLLERIPRPFRHAYLLLVVLIGWTIFQLGSPGEILSYLGDMFGLTGIDLANNEAWFLLRSNIVLLVLATAGSIPLFAKLYERTLPRLTVRTFVMPSYYAGLLLVSTAYLVDSSFNPFLYFRF